MDFREVKISVSVLISAFQAILFAVFSDLHLIWHPAQKCGLDNVWCF